MAKQKKSLSSRVKKNETPSVAAQEEALKQLQQKGGGSPNEKEQTRVSIDFPNDLYGIMKRETRKNGQTLRGFIVALVAANYNYEKEA